MTAAEEELGGDPELTVALIGSGRVADRLADDGPAGLAAEVAAATEGRITVHLARHSDTGAPVIESQILPDPSAAVTLLVFDDDLPGRWPGLEQARGSAARLVTDLKATGTRIIGIGASTVDPTQTTTAARAIERTAHELNLLLLELSVAEGISLVDVDRIVAQLGAEQHLAGFLEYDSPALDAVVTQLVHTIDDYGFFERRPLLPQVGARK